jgi:arylformamidase
MAKLVDLSHVIEPAWSPTRACRRRTSATSGRASNRPRFYEDGSTFQIGRIDMVANTGTYLDTPFHRYEDGADLARSTLEQVAGWTGSWCARRRLRVDADAFEGLDVRGKAVLVHTGWDRHWRTDAYFEDHPFLTEAAARLLVERGAALVGIDSHNIDDTRARAPVHTILLGAGVLICEHLTNLGALPDERLPLHRRAAKGRGHGHLPGARVRGLRLSSFA